MNALEQMTKAIDYIEENLDGEIDEKEIARIALCSSYHFKRMFLFLIGMPLSEYIRRRRLTLAALDLQTTDAKVIDIAVKYGYSSADAFSRAFQAMHQVTPSHARKKGVRLKIQPHVSFTLSLRGVLEMKYRIVEKEAFSVVGIKERFSYVDNLGASVGQMWGSVTEEIMGKLRSLARADPGGLVGAYSEMYEDNTTDYYIGVITTEECPEGFVKLAIEAQTWAVFEIEGPLPQAMSDVWGRIFSEFFPTTGYEHTPAPEIEWYSAGDMSSERYESEIWIPVVGG
ncbi:AraC family transcriptional regulator [Enterococcus florum]|uniref:AraC family transcriptional regulator n=1 Tax=Enterococcus florum TaxID=2480627 RepID=A0A4P5P9T4_9ENTE|nr:AraC family transcriptional regulator [Enterococcus florum]GCF93094.1 AraC family transcriptional regulator [Enterococcus florum]